MFSKKWAIVGGLLMLLGLMATTCTPEVVEVTKEVTREVTVEVVVTPTPEPTPTPIVVLDFEGCEKVTWEDQEGQTWYHINVADRPEDGPPTSYLVWERSVEGGPLLSKSGVFRNPEYTVPTPPIISDPRVRPDLKVWANEFCDEADEAFGNKFLGLTYTLREPNSFVGFYVFLDKEELQLDVERHALNIKMRGDSGVAKLELKLPGIGWFQHYVEVSATKTWETHSIPLQDFDRPEDWPADKELEFVVALEEAQVPQVQASGRLYLDDIGFSLVDEGEAAPTQEAPSPTAEGEKKPTLATPLPPADVSLEEQTAFIEEILKPTFEGLNAMVVPETGLPIDIADATTLKPAEQVPADEQPTKVSPTEIGFYLVTLVAQRDLGFMPDEEVQTKINRALDSLEQMERPDKFFYWFYDAITLEPAGDFVSSVDNLNLAAAFMVINQAFKGTALEDRTQTLLDEMDFGCFYNPQAGRINHGFNTTEGRCSPSSPYDYGHFFTEASLGAFVAVLKDDVPENAVRSMRLPSMVFETAAGGALALIGNWGGSLFEALTPYLFLETGPINVPAPIVENLRQMVRVHMEYAKKLGLPVWGFSPSQGTDGGYVSWGIPEAGEWGRGVEEEIRRKGYNPENPQVSPYSSFLVFGALGDSEADRLFIGHAIENLLEIRNLNTKASTEKRGFVDVIDGKGGQVGPNLLALDKSLEAISLFNYIQRGNGKKTIADYFWGYLEEIGEAERARTILSDIGEQVNLLLQLNEKAEGQVEITLLTDFDEEGSRVEEFGAFFSPPNKVRELAMADPKGEKERVLRVNYTVEDSGGIWFKPLRDVEPLSDYDFLEIAVRRDADGADQLKLELKIEEESTDVTLGVAYLKGIGEQWQTFRIPLTGAGSFGVKEQDLSKTPDTFVIVLEGRNLPQESGVVYIDAIALGKDE